MEFDCKHEGCELKVRYERHEDWGSTLNLKADTPASSFAVYLMCDRGHVERYVIPVARDGG